MRAIAGAGTRVDPFQPTSRGERRLPDWVIRVVLLLDQPLPVYPDGRTIAEPLADVGQFFCAAAPAGKIASARESKFVNGFKGRSAIQNRTSFPLDKLRKSELCCAIPPRWRGAHARSSRDVRRGCGGRGGSARRALSTRTAKACGPGTPTLVLSSQAILRVTGAKKPGSPGRARYKP